VEVIKVKPSFETFDPKVMIHYVVVPKDQTNENESEYEVSGKQQAKHKIRPLKQLCTQVSPNEYVIIGGYDVITDFEPITKAEIINTDTFETRELPSLPLKVHGGSIYCFEQKLIYAGGWICGEDQTAKNMKRAPWPYGQSTYQFWKNVDSVVGTCMLTLNIDHNLQRPDTAWNKEKFSNEKVCSSNANPLNVIAPGTCIFDEKILFVGGFLLHSRKPCRKIMTYCPKTFLTKQLRPKMPRHEEYLMPIVASINNEEILVVNVHAKERVGEMARISLATNDVSKLRMHTNFITSDFKFLTSNEDYIVFTSTKQAVIIEKDFIDGRKYSMAKYSDCKLHVLGRPAEDRGETIVSAPQEQKSELEQVEIEVKSNEAEGAARDNQ